MTRRPKNQHNKIGGVGVHVVAIYKLKLYILKNAQGIKLRGGLFNRFLENFLFRIFSIHQILVKTIEIRELLIQVYLHVFYLFIFLLPLLVSIDIFGHLMSVPKRIV